MGRSLSFRPFSARLVWEMNRSAARHAKRTRTSRSLRPFTGTPAERALPDRRHRFGSMEGSGRPVAQRRWSDPEYWKRRCLYCVRIRPTRRFDSPVSGYAPNPFHGAWAGLPLRNRRCPPLAAGQLTGHRFWRLLRVPVGVAHVCRTSPVSPITGLLIGMRVKCDSPAPGSCQP
jgi:hypothetical protein